MKPRYWMATAALVIFFGSCGQSLYRLATSPRKASPTPSDAPPRPLFGWDPGCVSDASDRWEPRLRLPLTESPCMDGALHRPVVDVTKDPQVLAAYGPVPPGAQRIANVAHEDRFWIAEVRGNAIASLHFERIGLRSAGASPVAGTQILVEFAPGSEPRLLKQNFGTSPGRQGVQAPLTQRVRRLILSATAAATSSPTLLCRLGRIPKGKPAEGRMPLRLEIRSAQQTYTDLKYRQPVSAVYSFALESLTPDERASFWNNYLNAAAENFRFLNAQVPTPGAKGSGAAVSSGEDSKAQREAQDTAKDGPEHKPEDKVAVPAERSDREMSAPSPKELFAQATVPSGDSACLSPLSLGEGTTEAEKSADEGASAPRPGEKLPGSDHLGHMAFLPPGLAIYRIAAPFLRLDQPIRKDLDAEIEPNSTIFERNPHAPR